MSVERKPRYPEIPLSRNYDDDNDDDDNNEITK